MRCSVSFVDEGPAARLARLTIVAGDLASPDAFVASARPKRLVLEIVGRPGVQTFALPPFPPHSTFEVRGLRAPPTAKARLRVVEVHPGHASDRVAIAELRVDPLYEASAADRPREDTADRAGHRSNDR